MTFEAPQLSQQVVENVIERNFLVVTPETLLLDAIALMNQKRFCDYGGVNDNESLDNNDPNFLNLDASTSNISNSSCVLVMQNDDELLGIFTERDIVRLSAAATDFEEVKIASVMTTPVVTLAQEDFSDIFAILFLFRRYRIRHLPILDDKGAVIGIVTPESIRKILRPDYFLKLRRVADIMTTNVIHANMTTSVLSIAQLMAEHRVSCVVITEEDDEYDLSHVGTIPVGIITERDIVQFQILQLDLAAIQAKTVMSTPLFLLAPEDSLWTAHQEMERRHVRRLVVSWDWGKGLGIVTQTSLLRIFDPIEMYSAIQILQRTVEQLQAEKEQLLQKQSIGTSG
ncbi:CBS domain-containing protein [Mastigocoleus sp. MO_188.B34]|uniref:CBS domain-containing protein n=1 Tax=Mastigocoleus sp. MO_188.B34 TaxID=3036635 RepID=UPI00260F3ADF|nr:CBS domain-containing protein [Mastigocoleus sp. MO_188.B34]MDJ0696916.1 CBS domain-containing protein [Mastigocoleus sp. MO_188.B34]